MCGMGESIGCDNLLNSSSRFGNQEPSTVSLLILPSTILKNFAALCGKAPGMNVSSSTIMVTEFPNPLRVVNCGSLTRRIPNTFPYQSTISRLGWDLLVFMYMIARMLVTF